MLEVYILSRCRSDMTHQQYVEHWRDKHAPLFASQPDTKPYVRRYIQSTVTEDRPRA
jgi:EthD domain-containing protein